MSEGRLCPSGRCRSGSTLIGVWTGEGLGFVSPPLPVDDSFVAAVEGTAPEQRFRFSERCLEHGCGQWTGSACGLIDRLLQDQPVGAKASLPACGIRSRCRWFAQEGAAACGICPLVVTDNVSSLQPLALELGSASADFEGERSR